MFFRLLVAIAFPFLVFAQTSSVADLERQLAERTAAYAARIERLDSLNGRIAALEMAQAARLAITDPVTRAFYDLPSVGRIKVTDSQGGNFGTGTVISSKPGETILLTVGHIFRKIDGNSVVSVDIYVPELGRVRTFAGKIIKYDLGRDLGVFKINTPTVFPALPIASIGEGSAVGDAVTSYGCGGGNPPKALGHTVTVINRYAGPENIECTGAPEQGRSGGCLLGKDGKIVGVCLAADNRDQRGLYSGIRPIHEFLEEAGVVIVPPVVKSVVLPMPNPGPASLNGLSIIPEKPPKPLPVAGVDDTDLDGMRAVLSAIIAPLQAKIDKLKKDGAMDAEIKPLQKQLDDLEKNVSEK